jgi:membrane protein DedA with SNARE-associated domain
MHAVAVAAASSAEAYGAWAYLAVFALMALTFVGVPAIGAAVVGWAAVLASQGKLNIWWVLIVAALGAEVGGIGGYHIGERWGRQLLQHPGPWLERRQNAVTRAEALYAKWGRLAVFFTPTIVSGLLKMKYSQFLVWNFAVGAVYVLSVGPAAYGVGKVSASEQDAGSLAALLIGLAIAAGCIVLAARYYRRRRARRLLGGVSPPEVSEDLR